MTKTAVFLDCNKNNTCDIGEIVKKFGGLCEISEIAVGRRNIDESILEDKTSEEGRVKPASLCFNGLGEMDSSQF